MNRIATVLGVLCALLLVGNVWQLRTNARLDATNDQLELDLEEAENELAVVRQVAAKKAAAARPQARPRRGAGRPAGAAGAAERPIARRPVGEPEQDRGERMEQVRATVRDRALERIYNVIEQTGQQRGWDGATIAEAQRIIEDSFLANGALREQARTGEIEPQDAIAEVERIREDAADALDALLGPEDHDLLRRRIRPKR